MIGFFEINAVTNFESCFNTALIDTVVYEKKPFENLIPDAGSVNHRGLRLLQQSHCRQRAVVAVSNTMPGKNIRAVAFHENESGFNVRQNNRICLGSSKKDGFE